jgi:hypothetical protein
MVDLTEVEMTKDKYSALMFCPRIRANRSKVKSSNMNMETTKEFRVRCETYKTIAICQLIRWFDEHPHHIDSHGALTIMLKYCGMLIAESGKTEAEARGRWVSMLIC